ncbi:MAG: hypothetical protein KC457_08345 [Myxococcales bacterium]|nr:hypothetical protein [Myxococcales bacterium]
MSTDSAFDPVHGGETDLVEARPQGAMRKDGSANLQKRVAPPKLTSLIGGGLD